MVQVEDLLTPEKSIDLTIEDNLALREACEEAWSISRPRGVANDCLGDAAIAEAGQTDGIERYRSRMEDLSTDDLKKLGSFVSKQLSMLTDMSLDDRINLSDIVSKLVSDISLGQENALQLVTVLGEGILATSAADFKVLREGTETLFSCF